MKKIYSFNGNNCRIQLVKNDSKLRYELYKNRKLISYDTNIYWLYRVMHQHIAYELLGILYSYSENEISQYTERGRKIMEELKIYKHEK